ncbi:MAG: SLBB domain-containing protein [SAR86 cluster bacterium]|nr:SLBB domain-containing protein [SAR86 cluster bacterium]
MKNILFVLVVLNGLFFSNLFVAAQSTGEITTAQAALLETLPPDQKESILGKMRQAEELKSELEQTFEEGINITKRQEEKILTAEEEAKYLEDSKDWIYGYEQFQTSPTTFAPISTIPIPTDFLLGPGDQIIIQYYGNQTESTEQIISRSGELNLPLLGPITLAGLTFTEAQDLVENRISIELIGTSVALTLGELRSITVYVLGEAYSPGSYTVSALSSITNVLFVSGGVNEKGSVRNIQVKRGGQTTHVFDLYELLLKGDTKSDMRLQDGDVIFIPLFNKTARAEGFFRRPHLYEIKQGDAVEDLIFYAGGFTTNVTKNARLELSRINGETKERDLDVFFAEETSKLSKEVNDGDSIKVFEHASLEESSITIVGEVKFPGTYTVQKGDRLLDVLERAGGISEQGYILGSIFTRKKVAEQQKESFVQSADLLEQAIADAITTGNLELTNVSAASLQPISGLITRLRNTQPIGRLILDVDPLGLRSDPQKNILLENGDNLYIPKRPSSVSVSGEVFSPSSHTFKSSISIENYVNKAGGLRDTADISNMYIILPNGESSVISRRIFNNKNPNLVPGSTIVIPRDPRPFDWLVMTKTIAPIFSNLATSAAAIAAIDN